MVKIIFVNRDNSRTEVDAKEGLSLLEVAHEHDIDIEGACGGSLACSTCHVIIEDKYFGKLPNAEEDEEDMLDLAFGLTQTSRLGCQIIVNKDLEGMVVYLPSASRNR